MTNKIPILTWVEGRCPGTALERRLCSLLLICINLCGCPPTLLDLCLCEWIKVHIFQIRYIHLLIKK